MDPLQTITLIIFTATIVVVIFRWVDSVAAAMAVCAIGSAAVLLGFLIPAGTDRRVTLPWAALGRIALCMALTLATGLLMRRLLADAAALPTLILGASAAAVVCAAGACGPPFAHQLGQHRQQPAPGPPPETPVVSHSRSPSHAYSWPYWIPSRI